MGMSDIAIAADRNRPWKHVERARIVLASAEAALAAAGDAEHRCQPADGVAMEQRFAEGGIDALRLFFVRKLQLFVPAHRSGCSERPRGRSGHLRSGGRSALRLNSW